MFLLFMFLISSLVLCDSDDNSSGYNLVIGNSIDVFANYGDLSQVTQVISADYIDDEPLEVFREKNIQVFANASSEELYVDSVSNINIQLSDTFEGLLDMYFQNFGIEGTDKPWKAFMGDWVIDEIMRTFGIQQSYDTEDCCYAFVKLSKTHRTAKLGNLTNVAVKSYVVRAIDRLNVSNSTEIRKFMKSYGTHYIDSYSTGNFIYQVFKYKQNGYSRLKRYLRLSSHVNHKSLRYYFSSFFLKQIGDIRIASGNKTVEHWARKNLRDIQYLYSRPSLLRLSSPVLSTQLENLLDDSALLSLNLKTLQPLFKERYKGEHFKELVENDLQLWENNA